MPPPGGWQPPASTSSYPPPPVPAPGYPAPPPGWYPGAPVPSKRPRRTGLIVLAVVVPVLALAAIGLVFVRGTDPAAAKDRDAANTALVTNSDLGGAFAELEHATFARSRGGVRINDNIAGCEAINQKLEDDGQAFVETTLKAQTGLSFQIIFEQIFVMGSPGSASTLTSTTSTAIDSCFVALFEKGGSGGGLTVSVEPDSDPPIGNHAIAFHGAMSVPAGQVPGDFDIVVVQQGRAVVLMIAVDTTGSLHGTRLETLITASLVKLAPRFGS